MAEIRDIQSGEARSAEDVSKSTQKLEAQAKKAARKNIFRRVRHILGRIIITLATLALLAGAVLAVVYRDDLNVDSLRRMVSYFSLEKDESGQAEEIYYDVDDSNCFAQLNNALLVCSGSSIQLYSSSGTAYINQQVTLGTPTISAAGSYAVVYDMGGTSLYGVAGRQISYSESTSGTILNARINSNGYLTLITKETGYKGVITVYDSKYRAKVQVSISSSHVLDALVSNDGSTLAVVTIGVKNHTVVSIVTFYSVATGEQLEGGTYTLTGGTALDLVWQDDGLLLQMSEGTQYVTPTEGIVGGTTSSDRYLRGYAFGDEDYHICIWSIYQTGYQGAMELYDLEGNLLSSAGISQEVYSISSSGKYIALLFTNQLVIYNYSESGGLTVYATLTDTAGARQVLMRSDGSALLLGTDSATLFVP